MNFNRRGTGRPLLMLHGLGGRWQSWSNILDPLAGERDVVAVDLPGHGQTPRLAGPTTVPALADAVEVFLGEQELGGVDAVGSSMGARLVLELARRGTVGAVVALDPGGFWRGWERTAFHASLAASIRLIRTVRPALPVLLGNPVTRSMLLAQFSAHPWRLPSGLALDELRSYADTAVFDELLHSLAYGPEQAGMPAEPGRREIVIGWGRRDRVTLPRQAARATTLFPAARLHWFDHSGHFPHWDEPGRAVELILSSTRG